MAYVTTRGTKIQSVIAVGNLQNLMGLGGRAIHGRSVILSPTGAKKIYAFKEGDHSSISQARRILAQGDEIFSGFGRPISRRFWSEALLRVHYAAFRCGCFCGRVF